jgi:hypothetical protein
MTELREFPIPPDIVIERDPVSVHHPVLAAVKQYWEEKRGRRRMPSRGDVDPKEIKTLLPQVLLADVMSGGNDFRYRLVGSRLRPYFPAEATGRIMSEALAPFGEVTVTATLAVYRTVAIERVPLRVIGPGETFSQPSKFFESILLPLGDDEEQSNMIFSAFEFDWVNVPGLRI